MRCSEAMQDRGRFWCKALGRGWYQIVHIKEHAELAVILFGGLLALLGLGTWLNYVDAQQWIAPAFIVGTLFLIVSEGAYIQWKNADDALQRTQTARPIIELGAPVSYPDETLQRTYMTSPSWPLGTSRPPQYRVPGGIEAVHVYRIPIRNSGANAPSVFVKLISVDPPLLGGFPNPVLHLAGDSPEDHVSYERSRGFPLPTGDTEYIDVIAMKKTEPYTCYVWSIASEDAVEEVQLNGTHIFEIGAFAGSSPAPPRKYLVDADRTNGRLSMDSVPS